jgi:hypothetical protein
MNQEQLNITLAFITPGIIQLLMDKRCITAEAASMILYNSKIYKLLEDEKTKLWHLSYPILYDMLEEELSTGEITFPEEQ